MITRPKIKPKDLPAYQKAKAERLRNRILIGLAIFTVLAIVFWKFTLVVILVALSSIFTASNSWVVPFFAYTFYRDNHR